MTEEKQTPPEPMQFVRTSAGPSTPPPPISVQVLDQLGDIVGVISLAYLCVHGRLGGLEAGGLILSLLGVQTGVRRIVANKGGSSLPPPPSAGVGAVALLLLSLFGTSHSHTGFAVFRVVRGLALVTVVAVALSVFNGCASQQDSMTQVVNGYSTFHLWAQRICGVVTMLPSPPTMRSFVGIDSGAALDASVP